MAKQTKSEVAAQAANTTTPAATALKESAKARARASLNDLFIPVAEYKEDASKRIAPQMKLIIATITAAGKGGITREALCKNLTGAIVTRQPVNRVVTYYQKPMIELGAITITKGS